MKILIFNWRDLRHSWAGGGEIYVFEQAKRWVKMGHAVSVFCGQDQEKPLPNFEVIDGIAIYRKGGRYSLYPWSIWYYITQFKDKFDIVVDVENGIPFFTPLFSKTPKVCFVYHVHDKQWFYEMLFPLNYIGYIVEKYFFPLLYNSTKIISISETTKKQLINLSFSKKNIFVVRCGINGFKKNKKTPSKFSHPTILYLGRIKKYKRVDLLVNIFPKIVENISQARLIIAGWGTEASNVTDLVMRNNFRRKITLLGPVSENEKKNLLSKAWIFVNPSIGEGWSIAVIEANLHGTPAVAFNVSGLTESIIDGKTGLLAKNENELIEKICLLLNNKKLYNKLRSNAREWASQFNWDKTASKSIKLFKKLSKK